MSAESRYDMLTVAELVRSVDVNSGTPHAIFLGAGASINANVPSASDCIWQWKQKIVLSHNQGLRTHLGNLEMQSVRYHIQQWLDVEEKYPPLGSSEEYGFYIEACYPLPNDRQRYFGKLAKEAKPTDGYRLLCLLALGEVIRSVWTTNFDGLVPRAAASMRDPSLTVFEAGIDSKQRINLQLARGELLYVSLHGDYRYDPLRNTPEELQALDKELSEALIRHLRDTHLIVVGYSGRDKSVMDALTTAYSQSGFGRLFWCGYDRDQPNQDVARLLSTAKQHGREAFYISTDGFEDLMLRLAVACLRGELQKRAETLRERLVERAAGKPKPFTVRTDRPTNIIRSNALEIECPAELLQFELSNLPYTGAWKHLRQSVGNRDLVVGLLRGKVLALGLHSDIKAAFGSSISTEVSYTHIDGNELRYSDGVIVGMLTEALAKRLSSLRGLKVERARRIWTLYVDQPTGRRTLDTIDCQVHDAAYLYIRNYRGKTYLVIEPTIRGSTTDGDRLTVDQERELRYRVLSKRFNKAVSDETIGWMKRLFPDGDTTICYPDDGSRFQYNVKAISPSLAIINKHGGRLLTVPSTLQRHIIHNGEEFDDPQLIFRTIQGDGFTTDVHPLRGMVRNHPYDHRLNEAALGREIRLGVICPSQDEQRVAAFLSTLHHRKSPNRLDDDYLLEYPGFQNAYGIPIDIAQPHNATWITSTDPAERTPAETGSLELRRRIIHHIDALRTSASPTTILIYIPDRWEQWTRFDTDDEYFDLHNSIKAYCVQHGVATQFLRDKTINYFEQCRVLWWLSLALYVKALRTPWALDSIQNDTAFVGIGYSTVRNAPRGKHIVLGCSHIYNSAGLGLGYRLSKIDEPLFDRRRNPHMSRFDARRVAENTQQLFYRAGAGIPKRIVIHKKTPFHHDERVGFVEGFSGIADLDMVEITDEHAWKYVACKSPANGVLNADSFPVRRGTSVVLDEHNALLWIHGATDSVRQGRHYFLGGRHIPSPVVITRHYGTSSLGTLAREILGLSKMNWNNFDLYSTMPATIETANLISHIGLLLERFGSLPYDYRLFM